MSQFKGEHLTGPQMKARLQSLGAQFLKDKSRPDLKTWIYRSTTTGAFIRARPAGQSKEWEVTYHSECPCPYS
jgi:hypothetical protein